MRGGITTCRGPAADDVRLPAAAKGRGGAEQTEPVYVFDRLTGQGDLGRVVETRCRVVLQSAGEKTSPNQPFHQAAPTPHHITMTDLIDFTRRLRAQALGVKRYEFEESLRAVRPANGQRQVGHAHHRQPRRRRQLAGSASTRDRWFTRQARNRRYVGRRTHTTGFSDLPIQQGVVGFTVPGGMAAGTGGPTGRTGRKWRGPRRAPGGVRRPFRERPQSRRPRRRDTSSQTRRGGAARRGGTGSGWCWRR